MTRDELLQEMERLVAAGDQKAYDEFVIGHFTEFPEETQGKILVGFYSDTLDRQAGDAAIAQIRQQGVEALEKIEQIEAALGKKE
jgi:hypothetical protein